MNKSLAQIGTTITLIGVIAFAVTMLTGPFFLCCLSSIFIALGFVLMNRGYYVFAPQDRKAAALSAVAFAVMYAFCNITVYFIQLTTVAAGNLSAEAQNLLNYQRFGMMFNLDLLGYSFMALSTFFAAFTLISTDKPTKALKILLLSHGIFAPVCFLLPILQLFQPDMAGGDLIGILVLEFWCALFTPICLLAYRYFKRMSA